MKKKIISAVLATMLTVSSVTAFASNDNHYPAKSLNSQNGYYTSLGLGMELVSRFDIDGDTSNGGLVEIVTYNTTAQLAYAVSGATGELICIPMNEISTKGLAGTGINMKSLVGDIENFTYGDMSSIAINSTNTKLAVAIQALDYVATGKIAIFDVNEDGTLAPNPVFVDCGIQPDAVTFTPDGNTILVANEGEPRYGYGDTAYDPEGSVTIIDPKKYTSKNVIFHDVYYDQNVLLKNGATPSQDFEPEYIACDNNYAYVCLQENNAIAVLDLNTQKFTGVYGLGLKNFGSHALDLQDDGKIEIKTYENVYGIYMPDGISIKEINGKTYLFTANEGDGRDWGDDTTSNYYTNESKSTKSPSGNVELEEKVTWFDPSDYSMLDQDKAYLYGGRSFSIFEINPNGLTQVFDSSSTFEDLTAIILPQYFNCSNDDITFEDRSGKKGTEPENVVVGEVGNKLYAFIGLERISGVMAYDVTDPLNVTFANYINTRDFSTDIKGDVAPEGMQFVDAADSATGKPLLLVANECSGTMSVIELTDLS